jgi:hypothetical protein
MLEERTARINKTVDECLDRISGKLDKRAEALAFIVERQGTMPPEELNTVETVVFRLIQDREERTAE